MKAYLKTASFFTVVILTVFSSLSTTAETYAYRHEDYVNIASPGPESYTMITVYTNPIQAYEPVYAWREHKIPSGNGSLGYNADLIGYTDSFGIYHFAAETPNDPIYCGKYKNERFAVGSPSAPKSDPITFIVYRSIDFGPADPNCIPSSLVNL